LAGKQVGIEPESALLWWGCHRPIIDVKRFAELPRCRVGFAESHVGQLGGVGDILAPIGEIEPARFTGAESGPPADIEATILVDTATEEPRRARFALDLFADRVEVEPVGSLNINWRP